jgi:hypothetical protein
MVTARCQEKNLSALNLEDLNPRRYLCISYAPELKIESIPQQWGNANSVPTLESFIDAAVIKSLHANALWYMSAALTPSFGDVAAETRGVLSVPAF